MGQVMQATAEGIITVNNAVKVEILDIKRMGLFRRLAVLVEWTVLNQEPERRWSYVGETLSTHINVDIRPEV